MKTIRYFTLLAFLFIASDFFAQKVKVRVHDGRRHGRHHGRVVVVKRSPYRPAKVVVYHPYWRPNHAYNRRWVFFPKYNLYWDNWRNQYVYLNGAVWVAQPTPPPVVVNVNLADEQNEELAEDKDDVDDVYQTPK